ncbi:Katanin p60 ATPase-containing subunit A1 [Zea mays]|uniref:Katanin p60 ATPase-containing subunit A1 n=1 Tax=Zea mays TaxID=4577 RepID=A0A1D6NFF2_MAIZE|nr:Katanin p60 ATPase-containing subunit A1 [Zea mays]
MRSCHAWTTARRLRRRAPPRRHPRRLARGTSTASYAAVHWWTGSAIPKRRSPTPSAGGFAAGLTWRASSASTSSSCRRPRRPGFTSSTSPSSSALDYLFQVAGRKSATLSIDDFYLTAKEQNELRDRYPGNALLELRGNAGSHNLQFSVETLESLMKLTKEGIKMKVPRYDKSAFGGRGDRADPSVWPEVEGPLEVVFFEGWMLGFKPLPNEVVKAVDPQLEVVNNNLEAYYDAWDRFIDSWIVIKIREPSSVYQWRLQAEIAMRADGKPGMSDEEVMDFVSRYLPAYHAYLPKLYKEGPNGSKPDHLLVIDIDEGRNPRS